MLADLIKAVDEFINQNRENESRAKIVALARSSEWAAVDLHRVQIIYGDRPRAHAADHRRRRHRPTAAHHALKRTAFS
jgi:hypothetical protein